MRQAVHFLCFLLWIIPPSWALYQSEVGVVDWHKNLIGIPLHLSRSTAPVFHRVGGENTQSVILTATESNVLAALNPVNGSVAWRYIFESQDRIVQFCKHDKVVVSLSGPGGATLRSFDALTGQLLVEKRLHAPELANPSDFGTDLAFVHDRSAKESFHSDAFVLTNGHTVLRIDGLDGRTKWSWTSPDHGSLTVFTHVFATPTTIYVVGLAKSIASYTLYVTTLSTSTGEEVWSAHVPSSITHGSDIHIVQDIRQSSAVPVLAWLQRDELMSFALTPQLVGKPESTKGAKYQELVDVGLRHYGRLVAIKSDGSSSVLRLATDDPAFRTLWDFADYDASDSNSRPLFAGGFDRHGLPYVSRVRWSREMKQLVVDVFGAHLASGQGMLTGYLIPFDTNTHGNVNHVAIDNANPDPRTVLTRVLITSSTGAVQLWQQDKVQWTREESLTTISVAEFVELPERVILSHIGQERETALARLRRQLVDAQNFPRFIVNFAKRFATGSYASALSTPKVDGEPLFRDEFGFRQVIVAATPYGKVFGIDSSNGDIVWSRVFGLGWATQVGGRMIPVKLFVTRTASDGDTPQVVIVAQRKADNNQTDTVVFHLDALSGEDVTGISPAGGTLQGIEPFSGPLLDAFLFQGDKKTVVLVDGYLRASIFPDTPQHQTAVAKALPSLHFPLHTGPHRVLGHQAILDADLGNNIIGYPTWSFSLLPEEKIKAIAPSSKGPVASVGKVLGNRTTLYKYLNPRLFVVLTESSTASISCGVYVVDGAKGTVVYRARVTAHHGTCDITASLTENWLVYHYYEGSFGVGQAKSHRMVSVELYEGGQIDDKTSSSDMSSYSIGTLNVSAIEQSYIFPHGITAMTTTSTKYGMTSKDIIVANRNHQIQCYPHRFLDPRRPDRKVTTEEQEEFLIQYEPVLPNDPRRVLSHNYEVANVRRIVTAPALLESTSLVFAYGLDLFSTRIAPSGTFDVLSEEFNKAQLVFTVTGLALAIMITKPMVARKRLRERWYQ